ncbi:hypothetical protein WA026_004646 [Henosepilachna vigintioctopunctata]|uniref:Uncharacterized protein n=1 Tax=Henosepilachna vigintioctopunctata TaxID=420089 RepID=A0AAW1VBF8_9CUCU
MRYISLIFLAYCLFCAVTSTSADTKNEDKTTNFSFGQPFDEIVVQSSLTIRGRTTSRQVKDPQKITSN